LVSDKGLAQGTLSPMKTVVLGPPPQELQTLIERRRALGLDGYDEVWNGEYHVAPAANSRHGAVQAAVLALLRAHAADPRLVVGPFNLGTAHNYRVPDGGVLHDGASGLYLPTAALALEVISPDDESYAKLDHYAQHRVAELIYVDLERGDVQLRRLVGNAYHSVEQLTVVDLTVEQVEGCL
jgi:hypothetical protein